MNFLKEVILHFKRRYEQKKLLRSYHSAVWAIRERNSERIIKETLMPNIRKIFFNDTGLLMTDSEALNTSVSVFLALKQAGRIDELNSVVELQRD